MTINQALNQGIDAEVLLSHILKRDKAWLFANPKYKLTALQATTYKLLAAKRLRRWPVSYLTGHKEFYGLEFKVAPNVLIPRPETELLVERALEILQTTNYKLPTTILDVGTGSGNIIISIAKKLTEYPGLVQDTPHLYAVDSSKKALAIARANARRHRVLKKIKFVKSNLLSALPATTYKLPTLILANLPYLTISQYNSNPDLHHEPRSALVAGRDGLKYYRQLFKQINLQATTYKLPATLLLEHDPAQVSKLKSLTKKYFPNAKIRFHKDLSKKYRVCEIHSNNI